MEHGPSPLASQTRTPHKYPKQLITTTLERSLLPLVESERIFTHSGQIYEARIASDTPNDNFPHRSSPREKHISR